MDENELEQVLRAGLESRAAETDVTAPVADRARAEVSRRRRTRWGAVGAAAAVVLVVGGVAVATRGGGDDARRPPSVEPALNDRWSARAHAGWRTEYWRGVAVDVPADWGYGGAPYDGETACYPEAMVAADGSRPGRADDLGCVGRPIAVTDVCALIPTSLGADGALRLAGCRASSPGTYEYDNGYVQETIEVGGVTVTVGSERRCAARGDPGDRAIERGHGLRTSAPRDAARRHRD